MLLSLLLFHSSIFSSVYHPTLNLRIFMTSQTDVELIDAGLQKKLLVRGCNDVIPLLYYSLKHHISTLTEDSEDLVSGIPRVPLHLKYTVLDRSYRRWTLPVGTLTVHGRPRHVHHSPSSSLHDRLSKPNRDHHRPPEVHTKSTVWNCLHV